MRNHSPGGCGRDKFEHRGIVMRIARLCLALSFLILVPSGTAAFQPGPGSYRVDWLQAPFDGPLWLVQCTGPCPDDGLALVANPGGFPAGSLRVLGGPYRHGADLMLDRNRLVAAGLPARPLRVDVRDDRGQPLDGVLLADPAELGRLAATFAGRPGPPAAPGQATPAPAAPVQAAPTPAVPGAVSTLCRFRNGPQAGRTVDYAGRPGVTGIEIGRYCADIDGSLGVVVAPNAP